MKNKEIIKMAEILSNEKDLTKEQVFVSLENALSVAAKKEFGRFNIKTKIDRVTGEYEMWRIWDVVDDNYEDFDSNVNLYDDQAEEKTGKQLAIGETVEEFLTDEPLGRKSAQIFKQSLRENLKRVQGHKNQVEYEKHCGEIFNVTVKGFAKGDVLVSIGDEVEGIMPKSNLSSKDFFKIDQRVPAVLLEVVDNYKGHQLVFDRASEEYVKGLFKKEIPEVANENIEIRAIAREKGFRTLVLVKSLAPYVDAMRECIGHKGTRIKYISENMGGETINLIEEKDTDVQTYLEILSPIEPISIYINDEQRKIEVALKEEDIAKLNGYSGVGIKLIEKLTKMEWSLFTESEFDKKQNKNVNGIVDMFKEKLNIDEEFAVALFEEGFEDIDSIAYAPRHVMLDIDGMDNELAEELQGTARKSIIEEENQVFEKSELSKMKELSRQDVRALYNSGIKNKELLAELCLDELLEIIQMPKEKASELIMDARKDWF